MYRLKRYGLMFFILCMMGMGMACEPLSEMKENISEEKERKELARHAQEVNEHGFMVVFDGQELFVPAQMSESMHLLMPIKTAVSTFGVQIMPGEDGLGYVDGQPVENVIVRQSVSDGSKNEADLKQNRMHPENVFVDINRMASSLELTLDWNDSAYIMRIQSSEAMELPVRYDLREIRNLNPVDDQGGYGTCWAFASTAALEMIPSVDEGAHFSVDHMTMNNGFNISPEDGGDYNMAIAYLSAWRGPVSEAEDPYGDGETNTLLDAEKHLQEAQILKEKDLNKIKQLILTYGGVESPIYMSISHARDQSEDYEPSKSAYFYSGEAEANHDVVIIGWDDDFSRENFNHVPENDGAFICRNSWGETFGEQGYFYVSYEDKVLGQQIVAYTRLDNPDNYSRIYQSDMLGWVGTLGYGEERAWFSNVYTSDEDEMLSAAGFYAVDDDSQYDLYVVQDFDETADLENGIYMGSGYCENAGYYTVDFPKPILVKADEPFAIVICMTTEDCERPIAIEYPASELTSDAAIDDGEGYVSYDGTAWVSAEQEYECNVCLKAFTE